MPIGKFQCHECGKEFAKIFFNEANAPRTCPVCGAENVEAIGPAFPEEEGVNNRPLCMTCDSCESGVCDPLNTCEP